MTRELAAVCDTSNKLQMIVVMTRKRRFISGQGGEVDRTRLNQKLVPPGSLTKVRSSLYNGDKS